MTDNNLILETEHLNIYYHGLHAIRNVSMQLPQRQITALIGASGSGKSSFLRSLNRMLDVIPHARVAGSIRFHGANILEPTTDVIELRRRVGMVFQNPVPFPMSIYDNVAYGLEIQGIPKKRKPPVLSFKEQKINPASIVDSADPLDQAIYRSLREAALWDEVRDRLHASAYSLSGGQQQRLCIARTIAIRPQVILLDEPCSALDPISTHKIESLLTELKKEYTIVIVTHNLHQARRISDWTGFFHLGELVEFGPTEKIFGQADNQLTRDYVRGEFG